MNCKLNNNNSSICRDSNIELLRIILMFFIIIHHLIMHGSHLSHVKNLPFNFATYQNMFIESFVLFPVDCFIFISGYYGIHLQLKKTFSLWFQCFSYSVSIVFLFFFITNEVGIMDLIKSFMPITFSEWWFITCYFILMLLSPALNLISSFIKKSMFEYILIIGIIINCWISFLTKNSAIGGDGSTLVNFIFIYLIGRFVRIHGATFSFSRLNSLCIYLICCFAIAGTSIIMKIYLSGEGIWRIYQFNNPLIIVQTICIFYLFKTINLKNEYVNRMGGMVLSVYLIHDNGLVRGFMFNKMIRMDHFSGDLTYILFLLLFALIIFIGSICIEIIRERLSRQILHSIYMNKTFLNLESKLHFFLENNLDAMSIKNLG